MAGDWAKWALSACVSAMLTGTAAWFTFGNDKVTRADMVEYVAQQQIPTDLRLDTTEADNTELRAVVKETSGQVQNLTVELRSFVAEMRAASK